MSAHVEVVIGVVRNDEDIELTLVASYTPAVRGRRYGHPDTWDPPAPEEIEIEKVLLDGKPWSSDLTRDEERSAYDTIREAASDAADDWDDARGEAEYDARGEW